MKRRASSSRPKGFGVGVGVGVARGRRRGRRGRVNAPHVEAQPLRLQVPSDVVRRMILAPEHDLVARTEIEPGDNGAVGLTRVTLECYLFRLRAKVLCYFRARVLEQARELRAIGVRDVVVDVLRQRFHLLRNDARRRAKITRVERYAALGEGKLPADHLPIALAWIGRHRKSTRGENRFEKCAPGAHGSHASILSTIFPRAPGSMTFRCASAASSKLSLVPTIGRSELFSSPV